MRTNEVTILSLSRRKQSAFLFTMLHVFITSISLFSFIYLFPLVPLVIYLIVSVQQDTRLSLPSLLQIISHSFQFSYFSYYPLLIHLPPVSLPLLVICSFRLFQLFSLLTHAYLCKHTFASLLMFPFRFAALSKCTLSLPFLSIYSAGLSPSHFLFFSVFVFSCHIISRSFLSSALVPFLSQASVYEISTQVPRAPFRRGQ